MPPPIEFQMECQKLASGFFGSLISVLIHKKQTFLQSITQLLCGVIVARYLGPTLADFFHIGESVSGFIAGLFGVAILSKTFEMLEYFDTKQAISELWAAIISRIKGK